MQYTFENHSFCQMYSHIALICSSTFPHSVPLRTLLKNVWKEGWFKSCEEKSEWMNTRRVWFWARFRSTNNASKWRKLFTRQNLWWICYALQLPLNMRMECIGGSRYHRQHQLHRCVHWSLSHWVFVRVVRFVSNGNRDYEIDTRTFETAASFAWALRKRKMLRATRFVLCQHVVIIIIIIEIAIYFAILLQQQCTLWMAASVPHLPNHRQRRLHARENVAPLFWWWHRCACVRIKDPIKVDCRLIRFSVWARRFIKVTQISNVIYFRLSHFGFLWS